METETERQKGSFHYALKEITWIYKYHCVAIAYSIQYNINMLYGLVA